MKTLIILLSSTFVSLSSAAAENKLANQLAELLIQKKVPTSGTVTTTVGPTGVTCKSSLDQNQWCDFSWIEKGATKVARLENQQAQVALEAIAVSGFRPKDETSFELKNFTCHKVREFGTSDFSCSFEATYRID